ncbi:hypothetical protein [Cohnella sp. REN36]|uniref:hypothetical protein n=1 Tax=Cohnella sp. REN36 TaxID=2887347 RepID=UPI001D154DBF|nr:hypothetical protein [Cohnella sp. REN36]MCC3376813.1 hypothetical protein [Cohnella sp. REN36]
MDDPLQGMAERARTIRARCLPPLTAVTYGTTGVSPPGSENEAAYAPMRTDLI